MILKRILTTFDNLNLKRCKIDSEIEYGSQKGEIMVYKKRQRASVDQPCSREPGVLTSSSSSLTSREESQQVCSDQSKSSRGRVRAVPSRFRDSIVGTWKSLKSRKEESTETCIWGSSKLHRSKDPKLFPRKDNEDSSEVDCDYWDANFGMPKKSDASRKGVYKPEEFTVGDLVWAGCDWMPIGAFVLDSRTSLLTESLSGRLKVPKEGTIERMLQKCLIHDLQKLCQLQEKL
ncbi:putative histone-lysine N-methyltransferase [Arabidopsis thaliana]